MGKTLSGELSYRPELQVRRGKRDNLGIIFHLTPLKHMLGPIIKTVSGDDSNEGSQHMFLLRNQKNYF